MRIDTSKTEYHESDRAETEFDRAELRRARLLLRRLRFLEQQVRESGGLKDGAASGGAYFAEAEVEALEWVLGKEGIDYLGPRGIRETIGANQ